MDNHLWFHYSWTQISIGDYALSLFLEIVEGVKDQRRRLCDITVNAMRECSDASASFIHLSKPFTVAVVQMLSFEENQTCFTDLGCFRMFQAKFSFKHFHFLR